MSSSLESSSGATTSKNSNNNYNNLGFPKKIEFNTEGKQTFVTRRYGDMKHLGISGIVSYFQTTCQSTEFVKKCKGFETPTFMANFQLSPGNPALAKFQGALENLDDDAILGLVFHGTPADNIDNICQNGLDHTKRKGQAYGPGEYFSKDPGISISYCRGGNRMLVFVVVMPPPPAGLDDDDEEPQAGLAGRKGWLAARKLGGFTASSGGPPPFGQNSSTASALLQKNHGLATTSDPHGNGNGNPFAPNFNSTTMGTVFGAANNAISGSLPGYSVPFGTGSLYNSGGTNNNNSNNNNKNASAPTFPSNVDSATSVLSQAVLTSAKAFGAPSSAANAQQNQQSQPLNRGRQARQRYRAIARCPAEYVVVNNNNHQLPIGTMTFTKVDDHVMSNSLQLRQQLLNMNKAVENSIKASEEAQLKAEIIQLLIAMNVNEASQVYIEHRHTLSDLTKKEISWYVQNAVGNDGRFLVFFPDMPKPMNSTELQQVMVQSVDHAMMHETQARQQLARTQMILAKKEEEEDGKNDGWGTDFKRKTPPKDPTDVPKKPRGAASITADIMRHLSSKRMDVASELYMQRGSLLDAFAKREISQCVHRCCDDPSLVPVLFPDLPVPDAAASITADIMRHLSSKRMDVASELYMQRGSLLDALAKREISQCVHRCCDDPSLVPVLFPDLPVPDAAGKPCGLV